MKTSEYFIDYQQQLQKALQSVSASDLDAVCEKISSERQPVYVCGNGGSAAIAQHFACDHAKGVYQDTTQRNTHFISLSTNASLITAIGNDCGFENIFSHQIGYLPRGGILLAISSSGQSPNIIEAIERAKLKGMVAIAMTGFTGGKARERADYCLHVDSHNYGIVEDAHQILMHVMAQSTRINYSSKSLENLKL